MKLIFLNDGQDTGVSTTMSLLDKKILRQHSVCGYRSYYVYPKNCKAKMILSVNSIDGSTGFAKIINCTSEIHSQVFLDDNEKAYLEKIVIKP